MTLFPINYLGKTYSTTIHKDLTEEEYESIMNGIKALPPIEEVQAQMRALAKGGTKFDKVYSYYFKKTVYKTKLIYNNWSIDEALNHKPLIEFFAGKVASNKKVFPDSMPLWKKVETAFRLCGFKTCSKPSNFPMKAMDGLLKRFCPQGGHFFDYSCGWGVRMFSALKNGVNYHGVDANDELVGQLLKARETWDMIVPNALSHDVRLGGSEDFVPKWEGLMDLAFSSPPYYSLEDYRIGEKQSYKEGMTFDAWVENYVGPTVKNCARYLKTNGVFAYNVKNNFNYIKHDLEKAWKDAAIKAGFSLSEEIPLKNITRVSGHKHEDGNTMVKHDNDETIVVWKKRL